VPETTKSISWIKNGSAFTKILCFEGFMDFLSYATLFGTRATEDYLILNSVSHVQKALEALKNTGYENIETFFDNDVAGQNATKVFKSELSNVKAQNAIYAQNEDLNAYLMDLRQKEFKK
jgi:Toprim-like